MTNDYELSSFTKEHLIYTPSQLAVKPRYEGDREIIIDDRGKHGLPMLPPPHITSLQSSFPRRTKGAHRPAYIFTGFQTEKSFELLILEC